MLASLLLTLTASALVVLAVASVGLLTAGRPAHAAATPGDNHRRLWLGAALAGVGGAGCALSLAGPLEAATTGVVLAGSALSFRRRCEVWRVRGVLVWALVVSATTCAVAWLALRIASAHSAGKLAVATVAWLVLVVALLRSRGHFRDLVARRSRRDPDRVRDAEPGPGREPAARLPVAWLVTSAAASAMVLAMGAGSTGTGDQPSSQAADEDSPTGDRPGGHGTSGPSRPSPSGTATSAAPERSSPGAGRAADTGASTGGAPVDSSTGRPPGGEGSTTPTDGTAPGPAPDSAPTKTPGYAKDKPHRPSDAPSPGSGRPGAS